MTSLRPIADAAASPQPPPRVKALHLIDSLGPGGAEQMLVTNLRRLPALGIDSEVCALQERDGNPIAAEIAALEVPVRTLTIRRLRQRDAYGQVRTAIAAADPDIVHTHLEFADVLGTLAARSLGIPTISTQHVIGTPTPRTKAALRFRLSAWVLRRYGHRVIAVSEGARLDHLETARLAPGRIITIHNGIEVERFATVPPGTRERVRSEFGIAPSAPLIVTVAVLRKPKGIQHALGALALLRRHHPTVRYLVVGDGPHRSALEQLAAEHGLEKTVVFAGSRADVPNMLAAGDIFMLPSLTEALPTVLAEAAAAGLPIVATTVGGIPEMAVHGSSAVLVAPGDEPALTDALSRLISNPRQAAAMGKAGRRIVRERFDVCRQASVLAEEYRHLIATKGRT
jgi:glycosyltransferase involved in cell wall biosynthesis